MTEATVSVSMPAGRLADDARMHTPAELLDIVLAAYERGLIDGAVQAGRNHWSDPEVTAAWRNHRVTAETAAMKRYAQAKYEARGLPSGYDYRGGAVDWDTGLPAGSGCAWLRRARARRNELRAAA